MLKLLAFLWSGCWHKWEYTGGQTKVYEGYGGRSPEYPAYTKYRYRCEKCGLIREFRA
jgi:hypothetical protein